MKDFKGYSYDRNWVKISECKRWNGSILDQYKIINFNRLHIPPKMFVDLNFTIKQINNKYYHYNQTSSMNENMATTATNKCSTADLWWSAGDLRITKSHILHRLHIWF